jgi:hypothetical protein
VAFAHLTPLGSPAPTRCVHRCVDDVIINGFVLVDVGVVGMGRLRRRWRRRWRWRRWERSLSTAGAAQHWVGGGCGCGGDSEGTTFYRHGGTRRGGEKPREAMEKAHGDERECGRRRHVEEALCRWDVSPGLPRKRLSLLR